MSTTLVDLEQRSQMYFQIASSAEEATDLIDHCQSYYCTMTQNNADTTIATMNEGDVKVRKKTRRWPAEWVSPTEQGSIRKAES